MRYRPLRHNSEFGRVYARGKAYVDHALVLYVLKTRAKQTRVGLTATKKVGCAVQRNRARRVMKAAIDEHLDYNIGGIQPDLCGAGGHPPAQELQVSRAVARLFRAQDCRTRPCAPTRRPPPAVRPAARPARRRRTPRHDAAAGSLPGRAVRPIRLYKRYISPASGTTCRFTPTCSEYAIQPYRSTAASKGCCWRPGAFCAAILLGVGLRPGARTGALEKSRPGAAPAPRPPAIGWNPDRQMSFL